MLRIGPTTLYSGLYSGSEFKSCAHTQVTARVNMAQIIINRCNIGLSFILDNYQRAERSDWWGLSPLFQFHQLLSNYFCGEWQINIMPGHILLALTAQNVTQKLLHLRLKRLARL